MINQETAELFQKQEEEMSKEEREVREMARKEKKKADQKFLKECKCFVSFMEGREKEFEECKNYLEHYMFNLIQLGGPINTDFLAGVRLTLEMFEELPIKWGNTFARLGKE